MDNNSSGFNPADIIWYFIMLFVFLPSVLSIFNLATIRMRRRWRIRSLEVKYHVRLITMIHREESLGLFGFKVARYIDIEESERILQAIYMTPSDMPIWMVLHTPGGLVLSAQQIALALKEHKGGVTVFVPHYAMSGGTLLALASDKIHMAPNAVLGPVDPQLRAGFVDQYPAASIIKALSVENPHREDKYLILKDVAEKSINQVHTLVLSLLTGKVKNANYLAYKLTMGTWTHDYPITATEAKDMGLFVDDEMPYDFYKLMELYKPARQPMGTDFIPRPYPPTPKE